MALNMSSILLQMTGLIINLFINKNKITFTAGGRDMYSFETDI